MRFRFFSIGLLVIGAFVPSLAYGQGGFFGPIIPDGGLCTCPGSAPDWGCLLQVVQRVINLGVSLAVVLIILALAYAGFLFMTRGASPGARAQARNVVTNSLIGLAIMLAAWLAVDFVMKAVYDPSALYTGETHLGPWNAIWAPTGADLCLVVNYKPSNLATGTVGVVLDALTGRPVPPVGGSSGVLCPDSNPGCSVAALMAQGLNERQARAMSCIAMTESSGNARAVNSESRACGLFQITNASTRGNWRQPQYHRPPCSVSTPCTNAACNLQTAVIMFRESGYRPWTCRNCNSKAQACITRYDPGN